MVSAPQRGGRGRLGEDPGEEDHAEQGEADDMDHGAPQADRPDPEELGPDQVEDHRDADHGAAQPQVMDQGGAPRPGGLGAPVSYTHLDVYKRQVWELLTPAAVLITVPAGLVFFFAQKHLVAGLTAGGTKG